MVTVVVDASVEAEPQVAGRSLTRIAIDRLKKDRTFLISGSILIVIVLIAIFAPVICSLLGVDPYSLDKNAIDDMGGGQDRAVLADEEPRAADIARGGAGTSLLAPDRAGGMDHIG